MSGQLLVYKGRMNRVPVFLGVNVTGETFESQIRAGADIDTPLIAEWDVTVTDAATGELMLELDHIASGQIAANSGLMDIKRVSGGIPFPIFDRHIEVVFVGAVTE